MLRLRLIAKDFGEHLGRPRAAPARRGVLPGEKREDGAGRACFIAEVEMVGAGVVKIDGFLDEAQAQNLAVKVKVALGAARDGRDVMPAQDTAFHVRGGVGK